MKKLISKSGIAAIVSLLLACWYVVWLTGQIERHPLWPMVRWPMDFYDRLDHQTPGTWSA